MEPNNSPPSNDLFQKVKSRIEIADVVTAFGLTLNAKDKCLCPFHSEKTPSFSIDRKSNIFTCFGCGASGDVVTFVSQIKGCEPLEAAKYLANQYHLDIDGNPKGSCISEYLARCIHDVRQTDYFFKRGLTLETIERFKLGYDPQRKSVVIPYSSDLQYYIARSVNEKKFFKPSTDEAGPEPLYNMKGLYAKKPIFIVESPICALSIMQYGHPAVALCGASAIHKLMRQVKTQRPSAPLILCLDNDEPGKKATDELAKSLDELKIPFIIYNVAKDKKDPNELLVADPRDFEQSIKDAVEKCAEVLSENVSAASQPANSEHGMISARELQQMEIDPPEWLIPGTLPKGLTLLVAASKMGKSWMSMQLCLAIAQGIPFMGFPTKKAGCLYLALEDSRMRLRTRLNLMLGQQAAPEHFSFDTTASPIDNGLFDELDRALKRDPGIKLVIIDTLQKVRGSSKKNEMAYASDYREISEIKMYADRHQIGILLVHHLRKMNDDADVYNKISGSTGIMGVADTIWIIDKKNRTDENAMLHMTGRDIEEKEIVVRFDKSTHEWCLVGTAEEEEEKRRRREYEDNLLVRTIKCLIANPPYQWSGTVSDLLKAIYDVTEQTYQASHAAVGKELAQLEIWLYYDDIKHEVKRNSKNVIHIFSRRQRYQHTYQPSMLDEDPFNAAATAEKESANSNSSPDKED